MDDCRNQSGRRFVLLRHELPHAAARGSHWDLMLENQGVLLTWELPKLPVGPLPATFEQLGIRRLPDHRIDYLEYEGPVSNARGTVQRVDFGVYQLTSGAIEESIHAVARGRQYQIELMIPKAIFLQVDLPAWATGEVVVFAKHANASG